MEQPAISITERSEHSRFAIDDLEDFFHRGPHNGRRLNIPFNRLMHVLLHAWRVGHERPGMTEIVLRFPER